MRPHQIIGAMSPEEFAKIMGAIEAESPEAIQSTTIAAAQVLKFRPKFLLKQPPAKRLGSVKGALSRVTAASLAEELLAVYFLKCRLELLTEWLDLMGLEHEDGILTQEEIPTPEADALKANVDTFLGGDDPDERKLLLEVFNAQTAIEWPALGELLAG
ncbi:MAG: hypothetical protein NXI30_15200 [bacterium]|nr:hypothetical protein [bacterium]